MTVTTGERGSAATEGARVRPSRWARLTRILHDGSLALIGRLLNETGREFARRYAIVLLLGVIVAATTALNAWVIKDVVNKIFVERRVDMLYLLSGIVVANGFVRGWALYASSVTLGRIGNAIVARTQRRMFDHLLSMGVDFFNRTASSDLVTRMSHNAAAARQVLDTLFTTTGRDLLTLIALVAVMFAQSPLMSLVLLVIGPLTILVVGRLGKRVRKVARAQFDSLSQVISDMQQTATGIRIIKAFNLEGMVRGRMATAIDQVRERSDKMVRIRARTGPFSEVLGGLAIGSVILWAGYRAIEFGEPPGALLSFLAAMALAYEPAKRLASAQVPLEAGLVGVRLMYELLDTKPSMNVNPDGPPLTLDRGEVTFEAVDFTYPAGHPLFRDLSFVAPGGRTTALVGPSGGGKSTMIALIERFYDVASGRILVDGQDISRVRLSSLRDQLALVSQETVLFNGTIRDNIRFGAPDASDADIETAARDAMAHDFIAAMPDGYDTAIGDGAVGLSGGQRQRIAIARAMLRDARILLLDEATSSLDSESEHQVQVALDRLMKGRTTIVIAHRLSTVLGADKIAVLVGGKIVEEGRHAELLARGQQYARLYRLQFESRRNAAGVTAVE